MLPKQFREILMFFTNPKVGHHFPCPYIGCHAKRLPADLTVREDEKCALFFWQLPCDRSRSLDFAFFVCRRKNEYDFKSWMGAGPNSENQRGMGSGNEAKHRKSLPNGRQQGGAFGAAPTSWPLATLKSKHLSKLWRGCGPRTLRCELSHFAPGPRARATCRQATTNRK